MSWETEADLVASATALLKALVRRGWQLGTAESLTGGMLGVAVTAVPGASASYRGGVIAYTDAEKTALLGVPGQLLEQRGAVSAEIAEAMAEGCRERLQVEVAIATTGIAGPASDDRRTPVGTVYVACVTPKGTRVERLKLDGDRDVIRGLSTRAALGLAVHLVEEELPKGEQRP